MSVTQILELDETERGLIVSSCIPHQLKDTPLHPPAQADGATKLTCKNRKKENRKRVCYLHATIEFLHRISRFLVVPRITQPTFRLSHVLHFSGHGHGCLHWHLHVYWCRSEHGAFPDIRQMERLVLLVVCALCMVSNHHCCGRAVFMPSSLGKPHQQQMWEAFWGWETDILSK